VKTRFDRVTLTSTTPASPVSASSLLPATTPSADEGFVPLFQNDSLFGWTGDLSSYQMRNGILSGGNGNLINPKEYGDFSLKFDLRLAAGSYVEMSIRGQTPPQPNSGAPNASFGVVLRDNTQSAAAALEPWKRHGAVYGYQEPLRTSGGTVGTWNEHEVRVENQHLTVTINGVIVQDTDLRNLTRKAPGGRSLDLSRTKGQIAILGFKGSTEFRNVRIKELGAVTTAATAPTASSTLWIDSKGRSLQAKFVRVEGGNVMLDIAGKVTPVALAALSTASQQVARDLQAVSSPTVPADALTFGTSRYAYFPATLTWAGAKAMAEAKGGHLATFTSAAEEAAVTSYLQARMVGQDVLHFWLGGYQARTAGSWAWLTGEPFTYKHWAQSEPDNSGGAGERGIAPFVLDCLIDKSGARWHDFSSAQTNWQKINTGYLVEWDNAASASTTSTPPAAQTATATSSAPTEAGFISLLEADQPGDWVQVGPGRLDLQNGLATTSSPIKWGVAIYSKRTFADFILKAEFKGVGPLFNSGLWLRIPDLRNDIFSAAANRYEVGIIHPGGDKGRFTGTIWGIQSARVDAVKANDWNELEVTVTGQRYVVKLNGQIVNDFIGNKGALGYIGLEENGEPGGGPVQFRNVRVKPLP
jgi:hypothetical protein